jgi:hypothetical protein
MKVDDLPFYLYFSGIKEQLKQRKVQLIMNHRAPRTEEKVDGLLVPTDDREFFLAIYNINLPFRLFDTPNSTVNVLERVKNLLMRDFVDLRATFQFTASYLLLHRVTGEQRIWTGSFYPRGNARTYLSAFKRFQSDTFVQFGLDSLQNVEYTLLNWPNRGDTSWVFNQVLSIIVNVQSLVPAQHFLINKFPRRNNGRKSQIVFPLP